MLKQQRRMYLPLVGTIMLCLVFGVFLAASKRSKKSTRSKKVTKHKVDTSPVETLEYWTADKKRKAKAVPLPEADNLDREKQAQRPSRQQDT